MGRRSGKIQGEQGRSPPLLSCAPSAFLSSRWSRDNLLTCDPAQLYDGRIDERIGVDLLEQLIAELSRQLGPFQVESGGLGVFTWDVSCQGPDGAFILRVPLSLDQPGTRGRSKKKVPQLSAANATHFIDQGLSRFVCPPRQVLTLRQNIPVATFDKADDYRPLTFGLGDARLDVYEGEKSWVVAPGPRTTAALVIEMVAVLAYHYEAERRGGTALTDICINDGDFLVRRAESGGYDLKLAAIRWLEPEVSPSLLLLYLIQMHAYEDWQMGETLTGLPVPVSSPLLVFEGLVRGRRYLWADLASDELRGEKEAMAWIRQFARTREGHSYRPWVDRFIAGETYDQEEDEPRRCWWNLTYQRQRAAVQSLRARHGRGAATSQGEAMHHFLNRLEAQIGRPSPHRESRCAINEWDRDQLVSFLGEDASSQASASAIFARFFSGWPYRDPEQLKKQLPQLASRSAQLAQFDFGEVTSDAIDGTLDCLGPVPPGGWPRALANPESIATLELPSSLHQQAAQRFLTFEGYMDAALHDPLWGYYTSRVVIGREGHFSTNPEKFSPHYGRWLATLVLGAWEEMVAQAELDAHQPYNVIEFGAGNGRLAKDFLDAIDQATSDPRSSVRQRWKAFSEVVSYRIYEISPLLRAKQAELLEGRAQVLAGDATRPQLALDRDFPDGVVGFVLSNELPDAFGVHKVVFSSDGEARVALVLPRLQQCQSPQLTSELRARVVATDRDLRASFGIGDHAEDWYLDRTTFQDVMAAFAPLEPQHRQQCLLGLWFREIYVDVSETPALAKHLSANALQYALALAAEDSGITSYINLRAANFMRQLGASLSAGFVLTIDYGDSTCGLAKSARLGAFPFRIYFDGEDHIPRPNDPYLVPGTQDMTADVNFTDLAGAGREVGLEVIHFGHERAIVGADLHDVLQAPEQEGIEAFLGAPVFKMLLQSTRRSDFFQPPSGSEERLFFDLEALPAARRERAAAICAQLQAVTDA